MSTHSSVGTMRENYQGPLSLSSEEGTYHHVVLSEEMSMTSNIHNNIYHLVSICRVSSIMLFHSLIRQTVILSPFYY